MAAVVQESMESRMADLADEAMYAFCDDVRTMFQADISCSPKQHAPATVSSLKKLFRRVCAVHTVKAEGTLEGTFHVIVDYGGVFTLGGIAVMLPEARILEETRRGTEKEAQALFDAVGEMGNLLVGSWGRVFGKGLPGHKHFLKSGTFIGLLWDKPQDILGLSKDDQLDLALYDVDVKPYPAFSCAVVFPKGFSTPETDSSEVEEEPPEPSTQAETVPSAAEAMTDEGPTSKKKGKAPEQAAPHPAAEAPAPQTPVAEAPEPETPVAEAAEPQTPVAEAPAPQTPVAVAPPVSPPTPPPSPAPCATVPADAGLAGLLGVSIQDIMTKEVVWVDPDDSVADVLRGMQQHNVGYAMVGHDGVLKGIVSKSNLMAAISPYLRPVFAKWRRPEDEATLSIKIKWFMTRPVRAVTTQTTLGQAIEAMQQFGGRCLPVIDHAGRVVGLVTVFDVFKTLNPHAFQGKTPQAPSLML